MQVADASCWCKLHTQVADTSCWCKLHTQVADDACTQHTLMHTCTHNCDAHKKIAALRTKAKEKENSKSKSTKWSKWSKFTACLILMPSPTTSLLIPQIWVHYGTSDLLVVYSTVIRCSTTTVLYYSSTALYSSPIPASYRPQFRTHAISSSLIRYRIIVDNRTIG